MKHLLSAITEKAGFTLIEIIIVVIIAGVLASVSIPKYTGLVEKSRASEGTYILGTLLSSQERYFLEHSSYANDPNKLDVTVPTPKYFNAPTVYSTCAAASTCARIQRKGGNYTLSINGNANVTCLSGGGSPTCSQAGY